jgi:hypothetical protein
MAYSTPVKPTPSKIYYLLDRRNPCVNGQIIRPCYNANGDHYIDGHEPWLENSDVRQPHVVGNRHQLVENQPHIAGNQLHGSGSHLVGNESYIVGNQPNIAGNQPHITGSRSHRVGNASNIVDNQPFSADSPLFGSHWLSTADQMYSSAYGTLTLEQTYSSAYGSSVDRDYRVCDNAKQNPELDKERKKRNRRRKKILRAEMEANHVVRAAMRREKYQPLESFQTSNAVTDQFDEENMYLREQIGPSVVDVNTSRITMCSSTDSRRDKGRSTMPHIGPYVVGSAEVSTDCNRK